MEVDKLWKIILGEIEVEVSRAQFASFFKNTSATKGKNKSSIIILCPNATSAFMLKQRFFSLIKNKLEQRINQPINLSFSIEQKVSPSIENAPLFQSQKPNNDLVKKAGLNPSYSFDNFAVSESNQMAFAAAQAVAQNLGKAYNPLFLWGSVGVGKTHLMQAIGRQVIMSNKNKKTIYCTGEDFTNEIIEAIRARSSGIFKRKYRKANLLMVDDVQFIAGKESVQMEFFHTFNSVLNSGGQIVLTSDNPPSQIKELEKRLRSRFEGGLIIDISPPNFELRTAILLIKAQSRGISIPIEIAKTLAANIEDVRALEGALLRFASEEKSGKSPQEAVSRILSKQAVSLSRPSVSPQKVIEVAASHFDLNVKKIKGKSRKKSIAFPRQIIMYILRQEMGLSYEEIGSLLGGRDHTTVLYGVEKISSLLPKKETVRENLTQIRKLVWA